MDSWDPSKHRTVIKCSSCGAEVSGFEEVCPMCGYQFADLASTLPALRQESQEMPTTEVRERLSEERWPVPRYVLVPALAGLLIAVIVVVFVRVFSEHKGSTQKPLRTDQEAGTGGASGSEGPAVGSTVSAQAGNKTGSEVPVSSVGPEVVRVMPIDIRFPLDGDGDRVVSGKQAERLRETMADSDLHTCALLSAEGGVSHAEFYFDRPLRFSHVLMQLGCPSEGEPESGVSCTLATEDGTRRRFRVQGWDRPSLVDLAGAWSGKISLEFDPGGLPVLGLAEISFYAFE